MMVLQRKVRPYISWISQLSIRQQVLLFTLLTLVLSLIIQSGFSAILLSGEYKTAILPTTTLPAFVSTSLDERLDRLHATASRVMQNDDVQGFLLSTRLVKEEPDLARDPVLVDDRVEMRASISTYMYGVSMTNPDIADIAIYDGDDFILSQKAVYNVGNILRLKEHGAFTDEMQMTDKITLNREEVYVDGFALAWPIMNRSHLYRPGDTDILGYCLIWLDRDSLTGLLDEYAEGNSSIAIHNGRGDIQASSSRQYQSEAGLLSRTIDLNLNDWTLTVQVRSPLRTFAFWQDTLVSLLLMLILGLLGIGLIIRALRLLEYPLDRIARVTASEQITGDAKRIEKIRDPDFGLIADLINQKLDEQDLSHSTLQALRQDYYMGQIRLELSAYRAMRQQINPHFIYNCLEAIRSIAAIHGDKDLVKIAVSIAEILRYQVSGGRYRPLKEEIGVLQAYLDVMQYRYPDRLDWEASDFGEAIWWEHCMIQHLSILPILVELLERAFEDGLSSVRVSLLLKPDEPSEELSVILKITPPVAVDMAFIKVLEERLQTFGKEGAHIKVLQDEEKTTCQIDMQVILKREI